jgi:hypothetical protein
MLPDANCPMQDQIEKDVTNCVWTESRRRRVNATGDGSNARMDNVLK